MLKKIFLWAVVIVLSVQIFSFSSANSTQSNDTSTKLTNVVVKVAKKTVAQKSDEKTLFSICHKIVRKLAHFTEYMTLAFFVAALCRSYNLKLKLSLLISAGYSLIFAASDEIHQLFVDGRSGQVTDVMIDFSGALQGTLIFILCHFIYVKYIKKSEM